MLNAARTKEGESLSTLFNAMLAQIEQLVAQAGEHAAKQPELVRERFKARLAEIARDVTIDQDRVAQEILTMATRADVREELDRLAAHIGIGAVDPGLGRSCRTEAGLSLSGA